jgi:hypothetical protein
MRAKFQCRVWLRRSRFVLVAALAMFVAGSAVATDGNYCEEFETYDCLVLDETVEDSCCMALDSSGLRNWTCTREAFLCMDGSDYVCVYGPGYNCHSPGSSCQ